MKQLNRYYRRSKISERKYRQLVRYFALDFTASDVARLTRKSVTAIFLKLQERIATECERASPFGECEVEVDESYFGARRVRGKRGRGASGKTIVFGIFKRNGMTKKFDLVVIGTGLAGTTVADKCRSAGWKVAIQSSHRHFQFRSTYDLVRRGP